MAPKPIFEPISLFFSFFSYFPREGETYIFTFVSYKKNNGIGLRTKNSTGGSFGSAEVHSWTGLGVFARLLQHVERGHQWHVVRLTTRECTR